MTSNSKIHLVVRFIGSVILCLAILFLLSDSMIRKNVHGMDNARANEVMKTSQMTTPGYLNILAGIPVLITGVLLLTTTCIENTWLKVFLTIFLLISMIMSLVVITEEGTTGTIFKFASKLPCNLFDRYGTEYCAKVKATAAWYHSLLILSGVILVLCLVALLAIFADWNLRQQQAYVNKQALKSYTGYQPLPVNDSHVDVSPESQLGKTAPYWLGHGSLKLNADDSMIDL